MHGLLQVSNTPFIAIFGAFQLLLSQIPDFDRLWFLSVLAAVMSFSYSSIGLGLAIGKATGVLLFLSALPTLDGAWTSHWQGNNCAAVSVCFADMYIMVRQR